MTYFGFSSLTVTLVLTVLFTLLLLPVLRRRHMGQRILEIGPRWHKSKEGTPTMGGLSFAAAVLLTTGLVAVALRRDGILLRRYFLVLAYAAANAAVGVVDDAAKLRKKKNEGLLPWQKLLLQTVFAAAFLLLWRLYGGSGTLLVIPYTGFYPDIGLLYYVLFLLFLLGTVNFVNLTDGIDGLAASVSLIVGAFYAVVAVLTGNLPLLVLASSLAGGMIGFLVFNAHPAKLFMGDTGSLFLGGLISGCAFLSESPLLLLPAGIVFYLEGLSVILQVVYFKLTRRRLFRMAPLHHHFEKGGWSEWKIVAVSAVTALLGAAVAVPGIF